MLVASCIIALDRFPGVGRAPNRDRASGADLAVTAEIGGPDRFIAPELVGLAAEHDPAGFKDETVIGDGQAHAGILLYQQDRRVPPDLRDDPEHRLHDDRRKTERMR